MQENQAHFWNQNATTATTFASSFLRRAVVASTAPSLQIWPAAMLFVERFRRIPHACSSTRGSLVPVRSFEHAMTDDKFMSLTCEWKVRLKDNKEDECIWRNLVVVVHG